MKEIIVSIIALVLFFYLLSLFWVFLIDPGGYGEGLFSNFFVFVFEITTKIIIGSLLILIFLGILGFLLTATGLI